MTTTIPETRLVLTRDEVLALLQAMGASGINGMDPEPLKGLSEQEATERLNGGAQTLLNRGLVQYEGEDTLKIDSAALALVGACVVPDATLLIAISAPTGTLEPHYFNATPSILVEQSSPRPGVFAFEYLPDVAALRARIQEVVGAAWANPALAAAAAIEMSDAALTEILTRARGGDAAGAERVLVQAGANSDSARQCATAISQANLFTGLVAWGLRNATPAGNDSLIVVNAPAGNWLIQPVPNSQKLIARPAAGPDCERAMLGLTAALERSHART